MKKTTFKKWVLSEDVRLAMLRNVCLADRRLTISTCEYQDDGRGHTYDTMTKLQKEYPDALLYFLIGGDKLNIISRWHSSREFFESFNFAVIKRNGTAPEQLIEKNSILSEYRSIFHMIPEPEGISEISSTAVREMLENKDPSVTEMIDPGVYELYRSSVRI